MIPVPFFQVFDFLDWLKKRDGGREREALDSGYVYEMAIRYLREDRGGDVINKYDLTYLMQIFQTCPMIQESEIEAQMQHFAKCGRCLEYLRRENLQSGSAELHPLLRGFLQFSQKEGFADYIQRKTSSIRLHDSLEISDERVNNRLRGLSEGNIFPLVIHEIGSELLEFFIRYIHDEAPEFLIHDYLQKRETLSRSTRGRDIPSNRDQTQREEGTEPLWTYPDVQMEARRLSESVRLFIEGSFYERQIEQHPEIRRIAYELALISENTVQSLEFLSWLQEKHPQLDILASVPMRQIQELAVEFCEHKNYKNANSFANEVTKWVNGQGERKIIQRLIEIGSRIKRRNKTYRSNVSPFSRYQTVPYHAVYLFLAVGDFPKYIQTYWEDLNCLTGDYIDVYYSFEDVEHKVSAFETVNEFRSLTVDATALPALLIWKQSLSDRCIIPLMNLPHPDIFDISKLIVQRIAEGKELHEIGAEALELVNEKIDALSPAPRVIIKGDMNMSKSEVKIGDHNTIHGNVVATQKIEHSFNKVEAADIPDEIKASLKQLAEAVNKMSGSLPKEVAEQVARDYETLVSEATSKTPRKAWWQLSVEGLKKAAENVGAIGKPVIELAGKIASLLMGMPS